MPAIKITEEQAKIFFRIRGAFGSFPYSGSIELKKFKEKQTLEEALSDVLENLQALSAAVVEGCNKAHEQEKELNTHRADITAIRRVFGTTVIHRELGT